jgi:hypothetical protein
LHLLVFNELIQTRRIHVSTCDLFNIAAATNFVLQLLRFEPSDLFKRWSPHRKVVVLSLLIIVKLDAFDSFELLAYRDTFMMSANLKMAFF